MGDPGPGTLATAAIVAIGSEMLGPLRQDTNSLWLTARLEEIGISVVRKVIVGDDPAVIREELDNAVRAAVDLSFAPPINTKKAYSSTRENSL